MATKLENGRLILNGETLPEALAFLAAGKVDQDTVAEWLVGRTDIGIAEVAAACFGPSARLRPTDLAFVDERRRARADAAAKAHGKKPPKLSYAEFLKEAGEIDIAIGDDTYTLKPRVFSTGTYGWFGQLKPGIVINGEKLRTSANVCLYVAHSGFRQDAAEAKAYAKKVADAKKAAGQSDDESDE